MTIIDPVPLPRALHKDDAHDHAHEKENVGKAEMEREESGGGVRSALALLLSKYKIAELSASCPTGNHFIKNKKK